jgi:hypothetical protein
MPPVTSGQTSSERAFLENFFSKHASSRGWQEHGLAAVTLLVEAARELSEKLDELGTSFAKP